MRIPRFFLPRRVGLRHVGAGGVGIDGVEALAGSHEKAVAFAATEADVGADFRQENLADTVAIRSKHVYPIVAVANPACAGPDVRCQGQALSLIHI